MPSRIDFLDVSLDVKYGDIFEVSKLAYCIGGECTEAGNTASEFSPNPSNNMTRLAG